MTQDGENLYRQAAPVLLISSGADPEAVLSIKSNATSLATLQPSGN